MNEHQPRTAAQALGALWSGKAPNTRRGYESDWKDFAAWCAASGACALPAQPQTVRLYLIDRAGVLKCSTLRRRAQAIGQVHIGAGYASPAAETVADALARIQTATRYTPASKAPILTDHLRAMVATLADSLLGSRDRALLLLGFAGAFPRSELTGLDVADLTFSSEGITVTLRRSAGARAQRHIPYGARPDTCPVRAVQAWLEAAGITSGPVFHSVNRHGQVQAGGLSDKAVALVVKRSAEAAGLNPDDYAGHSLRAGLATSAAAAGVSERAIMAQTGHRTAGGVYRYTKGASIERRNIALAVGL